MIRPSSRDILQGTSVSNLKFFIPGPTRWFLLVKSCRQMKQDSEHIANLKNVKIYKAISQTFKGLSFGPWQHISANLTTSITWQYTLSTWAKYQTSHIASRIISLGPMTIIHFPTQIGLPTAPDPGWVPFPQYTIGLVHALSLF